MPAAYSRCGTCGSIARHEGPPLDDFPACPECLQTHGQAAWPPQELAELRNFVLSLDEGSPSFGAVASVFTSAFLEGLLEKQVYAMALMDMDYNDAGVLADLLLESHQGRARLLHLYKRLGYRPLSADAAMAGCPAFVADWDAIARARNRILHGRPEAAKGITLPLIQRAFADGLEVFSLSHNTYNRETHRYLAATGHIRERDEEQERLKRWTRSASSSPEDT